MIIYRRRFIQCGETMFRRFPPARGVDVVVHLHQPEALAGHWCRKQFTILIDLSKSEDVLFAEVSGKTRNQIRAAAKVCSYEHWDAPDRALIEAFCDDFEAFAIGPPIDRRWLNGAAEAGQIRLSRTTSAEGLPLSRVIHYQSGDYVCERFALSLFRRYEDPKLRKLAGDAHRFQVWRDMLSFKNAGVNIYDLGGWYSGKSNAGLLRINAFKERFGGRLVTMFNCERAVTLPGHAYLASRRARALAAWLMQSPAARRDEADLGY